MVIPLAPLRVLDADYVLYACLQRAENLPEHIVVRLSACRCQEENRSEAGEFFVKDGDLQHPIN